MESEMGKILEKWVRSGFKILSEELSFEFFWVGA